MANEKEMQVGKVVQIIGAVVDIAFDDDKELPAIYNYELHRWHGTWNESSRHRPCYCSTGRRRLPWTYFQRSRTDSR